MPSSTLHTVIYVKNMVCDRCIRVVREEITRLGIPIASVSLGEVTLERSLHNDEYDALAEAMRRNGFELLEDHRSRLIEQIKHIVIDAVRDPKHVRGNLSDHIANQLGREYTYLSALFSATENITIEQYAILQRVEYVKELIVYDELTLAAIARKVGYSSTAHLSNQFKKVTGLTPSYFKVLKGEKRTAIDAVA